MLAFHTLISTHIYSSSSPGRVTLGVLKLHPRFTRVPAMPGLRVPCAEYHLAERRNSYWSVLTAFIWFTDLFWLRVLHCILEGESNWRFPPPESSLQWQWSIRGSRLELGPLALAHGGLYTCVAKNSEGQAQKDYALTVQGNSMFKLSLCLV